MTLKDLPIQQKLMRVIMMTCGIVLILNCSAFFIYELFTFRDITKRQLSTLGEIIAANCTAAIAFEDSNNATETLLALKAEKHIVAACLYDATGNLVAKYPENLADREVPVTIGPNGYKFSNSYLEGFQPVVQKSTRLGTLYLKSDMTAIYGRFRLYGIIAFVFIAVSIVFAYFFSKRLQRTISDPIMDLAKAAETISNNRDYTVRVSKKTDDELGVLTDAFNQMLNEIETQNLEITSFNHKLEEKVQNRTSELEKTNIILKQQNAFIETIIDASVDLIGVFDKDLHIVVLNKKADEIYKIKRETFIGKHLLEAFPQLKDSGMLINLKAAFGGETVRDANYRSVVSNRNFENFYIPLKDRNNEVYRVLVIGHDITDIIEANEKLKILNKQLEKSNRDLEQFAYIASHDLQEPLRKIQIFSELGGKNLQHHDIVKNYLGRINSSAERMTDLIKAVLNYSRLSDTGIELSQINLNHVLVSIKKDLELLIAEKNAKITNTNLPVIYGNPQQINQLFINLISNSLKFSERCPEIFISSSILSANEVRRDTRLPEGKYYELIFRDNGIGFEKQYANKIFSIFQRLHTSKSYPGTGIGLALCKKIVENHHGFIFADSEPGKGTSFIIYLPVVGGNGTS